MKNVNVQVKNYGSKLSKQVVDGVIDKFKKNKADGYILVGGNGMTKGAESSFNNFSTNVEKEGGFTKYITNDQANKLHNNLFNKVKNTLNNKN